MTTPVITPPVATARASAPRADRQSSGPGKGEDFTSALASAVESETSDTPKESKDAADPADKSGVQAAIESAVVALSATIPTGTPSASPIVVSAPDAAAAVAAVTPTVTAAVPAIQPAPNASLAEAPAAPAQDPHNFSEVAPSEAPKGGNFSEVAMIKAPVTPGVGAPAGATVAKEAPATVGAPVTAPADKAAAPAAATSTDQPVTPAAAASVATPPSDPQAGAAQAGAQAVTPAGPAAPVSAPAAAAPAAPSAPVPPAQQLAMHIVPLRQDADGIHRLTVHLHPADLGSVSVVAEIRNGDIHLQLAGGTEAGREALRTALPDLRRDLQESGFGSCQLDLRQDAPAGGQPQPRAHVVPPLEGLTTTEAEAGSGGLAPGPRPSHATSRLDLHV